MKINRRVRGDVVILELGGRLMGGPDSEALQKVIRELLTAGSRPVVIDLGHVGWVNSSGLGMLIAAFTTLKEAGGMLKLLNVSRRIEQILAVTKLNSIFEIHAEEDAVVGSFGG